jgi:putative membrane protein
MKLALFPAALGLLAMSALGQTQTPPTTGGAPGGMSGGGTAGSAGTMGAPGTMGTPGTMGQTGTDSMSSAGASGAKAAKGGADAKFAMMVAQTDLAEIQVGNMALQKSSNDEVKKVAQKLVDDHTKTSDALKQIAAKKGMTVPTETDAKHKALAKKLESESGATFDKDFLEANSKDHHKVVAAFQKEANDGKDPEIKGFAAQFLPAIQEHTTMIDQAKSSSAGTK